MDNFIKQISSLLSSPPVIFHRSGLAHHHHVACHVGRVGAGLVGVCVSVVGFGANGVGGWCW